jgi:hypothetical protein
MKGVLHIHGASSWQGLDCHTKLLCGAGATCHPDGDSTAPGDEVGALPCSNAYSARSSNGSGGAALAISVVGASVDRDPEQ